MRGTLCIALALLMLAGCETVQPWERGRLARQEMQFEPDQQSRQLEDQVYYSKEASSGGVKTAGAGCGCN